MAVVVTGAAGFIGRRLVRRMRDDGHDVVGVDRRGAAVEGVLHVRTELADADARADRLLGDAEAVFHLAGSPGVRAAGVDVDRRRSRDNVLAGAHALDATNARVPVIVASTSAVYGGAHDVGDGLRPLHEDDRLRPRGGYARSKVLLERLCEQRAGAGGRVAVVRPFTVIGEGQRPDMAVARWITAARRRLPLLLYGDPGRRRDVTDVDDVVEALVRVWRRGVHGTLNIGTGRPVTLGDMATIVADVVGVDLRTAVGPIHAEEAADTCADTTRCLDLLGMVPRTDLRAVVRRQATAQVEAELELTA